jgi:quinol monooxygenase YgiN
MIVTLMSVKAAAEKRIEVLQTLASLAPLIGREEGCVSCELFQECGDDTAFTLAGEWRSKAAFDEHLRSRLFGILLGLGPLLRRPIETSVSTLLSREGLEAVRRARGHAVAH